MSSVIETFLMCDSCGKNYGVDNRGYTVQKQRTSAKYDGWHYAGGKDYCQRCWAIKQQNKK